MIEWKREKWEGDEKEKKLGKMAWNKQNGKDR